MKNINAKNKWRRFNTSPYSWLDGCTVLLNNLTGPVKNAGDLQWIKQDETWSSSGKQKLSCLFLGDFLSIQDVDIEFDDELYALAKNSDLIIVNLEGNFSPTPRWSLFHQYNTVEKFLAITRLKPADRIIVSMANNHAADYGPEGIQTCSEILEQHGFRVVGLKGRESVELAQGVWLHAASLWSNQATSDIAAFCDIQPVAGAFNILYPHWGYELELLPRQDQVLQARALLPCWDMIVGHHAHVPQPVVMYAHEQKKRLVAYSLGDFACQFRRSHYRHGCVVRVQLAEDDNGATIIQHVQWLFSLCELVGKNNILVRLKKDSPYFDAIHS